MSNQLVGGTPSKDNRGRGRLDSGLLDEGTLDDTQYDHGDPFDGATPTSSSFDPPTPGDNLDA